MKGSLEMISFCSRLSYNMVDRGILASDWSNIKKSSLKLLNPLEPNWNDASEVLYNISSLY
jgi:hypothetical protein